MSRKRGDERSGRHFCASCFKEMSAEEYFAGDFYCVDCAEKADRGEYPLASTPDIKRESDGEKK